MLRAFWASLATLWRNHDDRVVRNSARTRSSSRSFVTLSLRRVVPELECDSRVAGLKTTGAIEANRQSASVTSVPKVRKERAFLPLPTAECVFFLFKQICLTCLPFLPSPVRLNVSARERSHASKEQGDRQPESVVRVQTSTELSALS